MFEIKIEVESKIYEDEIIKFLTEVSKNEMKRQGCTNCGSKNVILYLTEFGKTNVAGYYYCHDCSYQANFELRHNIYAELNNIEAQFKNIF